MKYRPGWTVNEIPSTLGRSRPLDRMCAATIAVPGPDSASVLKGAVRPASVAAGLPRGHRHRRSPCWRASVRAASLTTSATWPRRRAYRRSEHRATLVAWQLHDPYRPGRRCGRRLWLQIQIGGSCCSGLHEEAWLPRRRLASRARDGSVCRRTWRRKTTASAPSNFVLHRRRKPIIHHRIDPHRIWRGHAR